MDKTADKAAILELEAATVRLVFDSYTRDRLGTQVIATRSTSRVCAPATSRHGSRGRLMSFHRRR